MKRDVWRRHDAWGSEALRHEDVWENGDKAPCILNPTLQGGECSSSRPVKELLVSVG